MFPNLNHWYLPISGFFASSASSVVKRVLGKRMKIFDLQKVDGKKSNHHKGDTAPMHGMYSCNTFHL